MIDWSAALTVRFVDCVSDHALGKHSIKRLNRRFGQMPANLHGTRKKASVQQMQDRMLNTTNILVNVHPVASFFHICWS